MIRGYLFFVAMTGVVASLVGGVFSSSPPARAGSTPARQSEEASAVLWAAPMRAEAIAAPADGAVRLQRNADGHFYADVQVNGATINALVDTGASGIALSREDARRAGVAISIGMPNVIGQGADGEVYGEVVTLDSIALGTKTVTGMRAMVLNSGQQTLLGQSFLSRFDSVEMRGDTMVLR